MLNGVRLWQTRYSRSNNEGADWQIEVEFFTAVLAILDGELPALPGDHPYALALAKIQEGIAAGGPEDDERSQDDDLPFDTELIPRSIAALLGGPQEKMAHVQYLTAMSTQATDEKLKELLQVIQLGLSGSDLSQLGQNLSGVYREAWEAITVGVETGGVDPRLFAMIVQNTLAVLGPAAEQTKRMARCSHSDEEPGIGGGCTGVGCVAGCGYWAFGCGRKSRWVGYKLEGYLCAYMAGDCRATCVITRGLIGGISL